MSNYRNIFRNKNSSIIYSIEYNINFVQMLKIFLNYNICDLTYVNRKLFVTID